MKNPVWQRRALLNLGATIATASLLAACGGESGGPKTPGGGDGLVGKAAPAVVATPVTGDGPKNLTESKGQVTIVDFWGTFCEPCRKSFPKYQEMVDKFSGDLVVIGVSVDDPEDATEEQIKKFVEETGVSFPIVWDKERKTAGVYKPPKMPTSYVIDKEGKVRHVHAGYKTEEPEVIAKEVEALIGAK